jgi:hypothetical protein
MEVVPIELREKRNQAKKLHPLDGGESLEARCRVRSDNVPELGGEVGRVASSASKDADYDPARPARVDLMAGAGAFAKLSSEQKAAVVTFLKSLVNFSPER